MESLTAFLTIRRSSMSFAIGEEVEVLLEMHGELHQLMGHLV